MHSRWRSHSLATRYGEVTDAERDEKLGSEPWQTHAKHAVVVRTLGGDQCDTPPLLNPIPHPPSTP